MNSDLCRLTQFPRQNMPNETLHLRNFFYCCACISYLIPCEFSDRLQYLYRYRSSVCQFDGHTEEVSYANSLVVSSLHTEAMLKERTKPYCSLSLKPVHLNIITTGYHNYMACISLDSREKNIHNSGQKINHFYSNSRDRGLSRIF